MKSRDILNAVAKKHKVSDILGRDRFGHFVAARREAIVEMKAAGLTTGQIATIVCLNRDTVLHHVSERMRATRQKYHARRWREKQAARAQA